MASATARFLLPFTFHHHPTSQSQTPIFIKTPHFLLSNNHKPATLLRVSSSVDLSKEEDDDKPQSESNQTDPDPDPDLETDFQRPSERFAVLNTGVYECRSCGYCYETASGDPSYPIPPGFDFDKLPDDWRCPTCGAAKSFFVSKSVEVAGFAENQQFGLGGNTLTSAQKAVLIYGSLFLFFCLFLSGYFLQ